MHKIRVMYVIWSLGLGGAEQVIINLIRGLDRDRFEPMVCCLNEEGAFAGLVKERGVPVFALRKKTGLDLSTIGKIRRLLKEHRVDILHGHLWGGNLWGRLAARAARTPVVVVTEHNVDVWKKWHHKAMDRFLAGWTDKVIVVSQKVKDFYRSEVGLPEDKLVVIYNGIPLPGDPCPVRRQQALKKELGVADGIPVIANIGRLVPAKANHVFIEALRVLLKEGTPFQALIVGDGPLRRRLEEEGRDLVRDGVLCFTGLRQDVSDILDITDIAALSSTREGFSIVVLECMAKGIPFVATNVGGNDEQIIDGQTGFLTEVNDPRALAAAMSRLVKDGRLRRWMGQRARDRLRHHFSLSVMVKQTQDLYRCLLSQILR